MAPLILMSSLWGQMVQSSDSRALSEQGKEEAADIQNRGMILSVFENYRVMRQGMKISYIGVVERNNKEN